MSRLNWLPVLALAAVAGLSAGKAEAQYSGSRGFGGFSSVGSAFRGGSFGLSRSFGSGLSRSGFGRTAGFTRGFNSYSRFGSFNARYSRNYYRYRPTRSRFNSFSRSGFTGRRY